MKNLALFCAIALSCIYMNVAMAQQCSGKLPKKCKSAVKVIKKSSKKIDKATIKIQRAEQRFAIRWQNCARIVENPESPARKISRCATKRTRHAGKIAKLESKVTGNEQTAAAAMESARIECANNCTFAAPQTTATPTVTATPTIATGEYSELKLEIPHERAGSSGISIASAKQRRLIAIGLPTDRNGNLQTGSVSVFVDLQANGNYQHLARLLPQESAGNGIEFGQRVEMSADGNTIVISAPKTESVYVFQSNDGLAWQETQRLRASNHYPGDHFGSGLAISDDGDSIAVGAPAERSKSEDLPNDNSFYGSGAVYIFSRQGQQFIETDYVKEQIPAPHRQFGRRLAAAGSTFAVSCPGCRAPQGGKGAIQLLRVAAGQAAYEEVVLAPVGTEARNHWAESIDMQGSYIVVGAPGHGPNFEGQVFIYKRNAEEIVQAQVLTGPTAHNAPAYGNFGVDVAIRDEKILTSAPYSDVAAYNAGSIHSFVARGDQFEAERVITASDAQNYEQFGRAVAIVDGNLITTKAVTDKGLYIYMPIDG